MKKISRVSFIFTFCLIVVMMIQPITAAADVPYRTFSQNGYGELIETQTAYTPYQTLIQIGDTRLNAPRDMKVGDDGNLYIADTANKRVVVSDRQGNLIRTFGEGVLEDPRGLFVTAEGDVYIADYGVQGQDGFVVQFDKEGKEVIRYGRPDSLLYGGKTVPYRPVKIAVNEGGTMYIISDGNSNGIIQITPNDGGQFLGYFGTNTSVATFMQIFQRFLYGDNASGISIMPAAASNLTIDDSGLVYTLTGGDDQEAPIKKLNIAGVNMMTTDLAPSDGVCITVGQYENVLVATQTGRIFEYNKEGSLLFVFGGKDNGEYRVGLFNEISALDVDTEDKIYVLDSVSGEIQIFKQTEFTEKVHESLVLYQRGQYTASKEPLNEVIMMNSLFDYANLAMGQATYQEGNYEEAMRYYRLAKDTEGYSDAYWEVRNVWLRDNLFISLLIIVLVVAAWILLKKADKKWKIYDPIRKALKPVRETKTYQRLMYGKYFMRHPIDACYEVKRHGMQSYLTAFILTLLFTIIMVVNKYFSGFVVKTARDGRYEIPTDFVTVFGLIIIMSAVTYLICAINDGEGTMKNILNGYVYALTPYLIIQPCLFIFGLVVTYNEIFVIEFGNIAMLTWIVILVFLSIKEINNYSVKETFKVIGLTIFATFIFALMAFIMYVLVAQVWEFITAIYGEAVSRIVGN